MQGIIVLSIGVVLSVIILYSCLDASTTYDQEINDIEQEKFLKQYKK